MDPHHFSNLDPHRDQKKIRTQSVKLDPDPQQFADDKPKCMEYEPILAHFQGFEPLFDS